MSYGAVASPFILAAPRAGSTLRFDKVQGILAKANKKELPSFPCKKRMYLI